MSSTVRPTNRFRVMMDNRRKKTTNTAEGGYTLSIKGTAQEDIFTSEFLMNGLHLPLSTLFEFGFEFVKILAIFKDSSLSLIPCFQHKIAI
jgi:hypothetical protein